MSEGPVGFGVVGLGRAGWGIHVLQLRNRTDAKVVAVADARWGERPHALVVPRSNHRATLTSEDIRTHVAAGAAEGSISRYAIPERVTFVDKLERTSVGKINKRLLRKLYP